MTLRRARALAGLVLLFAAAAHAQPAGPPSPDVPAGPATVTGRLTHETRPDAVSAVSSRIAARMASAVAVAVARPVLVVVTSR